MFFKSGKIDVLIERVKKYAEGNLNDNLREEDYPLQLRLLVKYIMELIETLRRFTGEAQVASSKVSSAVKQVNSAILDTTTLAQDVRFASNYTKELTNKIAFSAEKATNKMEEVKKASETITGLAETIYEDSIVTKSIAEKGGKSVEEVNNAMIKIQQSSQEVGERIKILTENTREIDGLLANIQEISSKTNLLSLNATIEAARAGEYGRGFAVVANEIQKLAEASAVAANLANQLLVKIEKGVTEADKAMVIGTESVELGIKATRSAKESLDEIIQSTAKVETKLSRASESRKIQAETNESILNFINEMSMMCNEADAQVFKVVDYIGKQEKNLKTTEKMGEILVKVADDLVNITNSITLVDLSDSEKMNLEKRIHVLRKTLEEIVSTEEIISIEPKQHESILSELFETNSEFEAVWSNNLNGEFIVSIPPAGIANASNRDWFNEAIKDKFYISSIYISAISYRPCLTISLPIKDLNNKVIGVLGVDLKIVK